MAAHDKYDQDILKALRGIDSSLKRIANALTESDEKKQKTKNNVYYKTYCPICMYVFTFDSGYPIKNGTVPTMYVSCPRCNRLIQLPSNWKEECKVYEQDNEN